MAGLSHLKIIDPDTGKFFLSPDEDTPVSNVSFWINFAGAHRVYSEDFIPPLNVVQRPISEGPFRTMFSGEVAQIFSRYLPSVILRGVDVSQSYTERTTYNLGITFSSATSPESLEEVVSFIAY